MRVNSLKTSGVSEAASISATCTNTCPSCEQNRGHGAGCATTGPLLPMLAGERSEARELLEKRARAWCGIGLSPSCGTGTAATGAVGFGVTTLAVFNVVRYAAAKWRMHLDQDIPPASTSLCLHHTRGHQPAFLVH
jgi:hypothetical protein